MQKNKAKSLLMGLALILGAATLAKGSTVDLLNAIAVVESGGHDDVADGDDGKAIGVYQIHFVYWYDATHNSTGTQTIEGNYDDCRDPTYAAKIVVAYWGRYAKSALEKGDYEALSRIHNGGWNGAHKKSTLKYWERVKTQLLISQSKP